MKKLDNIRIHHSMLLGLCSQIKNYVNCYERGYLGETTEKEEALYQNILKTRDEIENMLMHYNIMEEKLSNNT